MKRDKAINRALSIFFTILSLAWIYPVFMIALNSFKKATAISSRYFAAYCVADGNC